MSFCIILFSDIPKIEHRIAHCAPFFYMVKLIRKKPSRKGWNNMAFYGRDKQRALLHTLFENDEMQVVLLYGRRRVGKSELLKQALRETNTRSIYYECKQTTEKNNVDSLAEIVSHQFQFPPLAFTSMESILDFLFKQSVKENLIVVLDEYPYLRNAVQGLDSILQSLADTYRDNAHLKFVLCGSYVEVMQSLLEVANPLYGRIDRTIALHPMDYWESALFYPDFCPEDKVRLYSVFGGIPYYNRLIDTSLTAQENITELIASPGARLENEVSMYLRSEVSRIVNANEVFETLAKGFYRFSDILSQSHVSSSPTLVDVLDKLIRMELVKKEAPINDERNRRKAGYIICDPLSLFYYRYCFRYASQLRIMDPAAFYELNIREDFETWYVPRWFEEICRQYLIRCNLAGRMPVTFTKIGKYWYDDPKQHKNGEFDLVTLDANGYIFYEAKFTKEPVTEVTMKQEIQQVNETGLACYKYGFFSRSGFADTEMENVIQIKLEQLYE